MFLINQNTFLIITEKRKTGNHACRVLIPQKTGLVDEHYLLGFYWHAANRHDIALTKNPKNNG